MLREEKPLPPRAASILLGVPLGWLVILDSGLVHEQGLVATVAQVAIVVACCVAVCWWNESGWEKTVRLVDRIVLAK